jgi:hypothetical protein
MYGATLNIPMKCERKISVSSCSDLVTAGEGGWRQQFKLRAKFFTVDPQQANRKLHTSYKKVGKLSQLYVIRVFM